MSVGPRAEKFNIVSNDHGRTHGLFLRKFGQEKNQNCQFKLKFGTLTNLNMQNSVVVFTFSILDQKHTFWANLVQKIKIVSLS